MPFSLLLLVYTLFSLVFYDGFDIKPILVILVTGAICGYFDYSRFITNGKIDFVIFIFTVVLFFGVFFLDISFNGILFIVAALAVNIGAIVNIIFNSISKLEGSEVEFRKKNEILKNNNNELKNEKKLLDKELLSHKEREIELSKAINENTQHIINLNRTNSELSANNDDLKARLDSIVRVKDDREKELSSLKNTTLLMQKSLREMEEDRESIEKYKKRLINKEKELIVELEKQSKSKEQEKDTVEKLNEQLIKVKQDLEENKKNVRRYKEDLIAREEQLTKEISQRSKDEGANKKITEQLKDQLIRVKSDLVESKKYVQKTKAELLEKEEKLKEEINNKKYSKSVNENITNDLKNQLKLIKKELKENEKEKTDNEKHLESIKKSLYEQIREKEELEYKVESIKEEYSQLLEESKKSSMDKKVVEDNLRKIKNEIEMHRKKDKENKETIENMSIQIKKLEVSDKFLGKWIEIEDILKRYSRSSYDTNSAKLINQYYADGEIDSYLKDDLHRLRIKRNQKTHTPNTVITEDDVDQAYECCDRLIRRLM